LFGIVTEKVDQEHAARSVGQIAAIAVGFDRRIGFKM
jgi:hypothetical protein